MSYHNTSSDYYCGLSKMDTYAEHGSDPNAYFNQNPTNYLIHKLVYSPENNEKQGMYHPTLPQEGSVYDPVQNQIIYESNHFSAVPQYNSIQYIPLTPEPVPYPVFQLKPRVHQNNTYMAKRHRAQITILPSSKGTFKTIVKRKRKRTVFTTEQVEALEEIFKTKQYINREERHEIVKNLQINDKAVKIWFQNRRLKIKRMQDESEEHEDNSNVCGIVVNERSSPDVDRLNSVESQISEKTDEFGFVTLDDRVMGDLVNVIDDFLTNSNVYPVNETIISDGSPIYEPISPASTTDSNEDYKPSSWRPSEPNESLQRLFDLQTMLSL